MPADSGLRSRDRQVVAPTARPQTPDPDPQDAILIADDGSRVGAQRDLKLVAEDQVLWDQVPSGTQKREYGADGEHNNFKHLPTIPTLGSLGSTNTELHLPPYSSRGLQITGLTILIQYAYCADILSMDWDGGVA